MQLQQRKRIFLKLWGWLCLSLNCLIIAILVSEKNPNFLEKGIFISIVAFWLGIVKTHRDKILNDFSKVSLGIQYLCTYIITAGMAVKASNYLMSFVPIIVLASVSIVEMMIFCSILWFRAIQHFVVHFIGINNK